MNTITKTVEELLEDLAAELEIPRSRYKAAEKLQFAQPMVGSARIIPQALPPGICSQSYFRLVL